MLHDKIRVAFFSDILIRDFDGAMRTMYQIIDRIPPDRFEFLFITGSTPDSSNTHSHIQVPVVRVPFHNTYRMAAPVFPSSTGIRKRLKEFSPHVIHIATPSPLGFFALDFAEKFRIPVVSIYHTHFVSYVDYYCRHIPYMIPYCKRWVENYTARFYKKCNLVLSPTIAVKKELENLGVPKGNIRIWGRGIDGALFSPMKKHMDFIQSITHNENPNILFASRLVWEKNLKTLIQIYKQAKRENLSYNFIIAGDGIASDALKREMPDAFFLNHIAHEELALLYASCDYFLFTSNTEAYGNVVIEAMASGLPCIIAEGGGPSSFIRNGHNGLICKTFDPESYLSALKLLQEDIFLKEQIIKNGLDFAQRLDWSVLAEIYFWNLEHLSTEPFHAPPSYSYRSDIAPETLT
jgi:glycosyltransferase involved in cell wall biosynthesis